jgi:hypothetical protein
VPVHVNTYIFYESFSDIVFFVPLTHSTGPSDVQCCVDGGSPTTGLFGVDIASTASSSTQSCFKSSGYGDFTVPRGYR